MLESHPYDQLIEEMKQSGVIFEEGLSNEELYHISNIGGLRLPPDLRAFLKRGLPVARKEVDFQGKEHITENFPNWRKSPQEIFEKTHERILHAFFFDIESGRNGFWMEAWGERPNRLSDALEIARRHIEAAPKMIPIYAHRHLPATPCLAGNPVFSIWQAIDTIYYGHNLEAYLRHEFLGIEDTARTRADYREIPLWSDLISWYGE
jgi:hypothetical protein